MGRSFNGVYEVSGNAYTSVLAYNDGLLIPCASMESNSFDLALKRKGNLMGRADGKWGGILFEMDRHGRNRYGLK